jgi:hypothetical protein
LRNGIFFGTNINNFLINDLMFLCSKLPDNPG